MKLILLNVVVIMLVVVPLFVLEWLSARSRWIEHHQGGLGLVLWAITLVAVYIWVLPPLGLRPNRRVLYP